MPLSWNQIRVNAKAFSASWVDAHYEKGETQSFYNDFFQVFGQNRRTVAIYEDQVKLLNNKRGFIDLFWPGKLIVEHKSAGRSLVDAGVQVDDYILAVEEHKRPRYKLLSDFQNFEFTDLETRTTTVFTLAELADKVELFDFIAGYHKQTYRDQDPVNIDASSKMSNLHRVLEENNYTGHDLELLLVRLMFCMFADDTGIFQPDSMIRLIEDRTASDGSDLGGKLVELFQVLDTPPGERQTNLDDYLNAFPYVNGALFRENIRTPSFTAAMRQALLDCCYFNWTKVSPALFGSLFQTVMLPLEQRQKGAHYTSERNILKTIKPLFLDALEAELDTIRQDRSTQKASRLKKFHDKLATLTFFDPACGCGNFLILAYRELREIEIKVLEELYPKDKFGNRQSVLDAGALSKLDVDQFYGIEIEEFPARIAEVALWLVDHQMNMKLGEAFGQAFERLPLQKAPHIAHANALRIDWASVLPPERCSYILGNPPFIGSKMMNVEQRKEINDLLPKIKGAGTLDYVCGWYIKAANYIQNTEVKVAFVSTNSITQGEQVSILWNELINKKHVAINFAHKTFKWTLDGKTAKGMKLAAVYVIIVGFSLPNNDRKYLYEYETIKSDPHKIEVKNINPYLVEAGNTLITKRSNPISDVPGIKFGNQPIDGGFFLLNDDERNTILSKHPHANKFIKKYVGADELINNLSRWCIWLESSSPNEYNKIPEIIERIEKVKKSRLESKRPDTKKLALTPSKFAFVSHQNTDYIAIPSVSSEKRYYIPIAFFNENVIASNLCLIIPNATIHHFGILTSAMHMAWVNSVCGRLESRYRYSNTLVYNNFPWPQNINEKQKENIAQKAQAVLDARNQFPESSLADLYDPLTMPPQLLKAHQALDKTIDTAYRTKPFENDRERVEFLFEMYKQISAPLDVMKKIRKKTKS